MLCASRTFLRFLPDRPNVWRWVVQEDVRHICVTATVLYALALLRSSWWNVPGARLLRTQGTSRRRQVVSWAQAHDLHAAIYRQGRFHALEAFLRGPLACCFRLFRRSPTDTPIAMQKMLLQGSVWLHSR